MITSGEPSQRVNSINPAAIIDWFNRFLSRVELVKWNYMWPVVEASHQSNVDLTAIRSILLISGQIKCLRWADVFGAKYQETLRTIGCKTLPLVGEAMC